METNSANAPKTLIGLFQSDNFSETEIRYRKADPPEFLDAILEKYFEKAKVKDVFQLDRKEINSRNYQIMLEANGMARRVLLREYKTLSDEGHVDFYLQILNALREKGIRVSRVISARDGKRCVSYRGLVYSVFDFIDSHYFIPSEDGLRAVAQEIARLHGAFNQLSSDTVDRVLALSKQGETFFNKIPSYSVGDFERIEALIARKESLEDLDRYVLDRFLFFKRTVAEIEKRRSDMAALPRGLFHSDLHPHNILMQGDDVQAIIDFDSLRVGAQATDVAYAILRLGKQFFVRRGVEAARKQAKHLARIFLESYGTIKELSKNELDLLPYLIKDEMVRKLLFVLGGVYIEQSNLWIHDLNKFIPAIEEIDYFF